MDVKNLARYKELMLISKEKGDIKEFKKSYFLR